MRLRGLRRVRPRVALSAWIKWVFAETERTTLFSLAQEFGAPMFREWRYLVNFPLHPMINLWDSEVYFLIS